MLRYHMTVITPDNRLKRAIKRVTTATGSQARFVGDAAAIVQDRTEDKIDLVIYDARRADPTQQSLAHLHRASAISYILPDNSLQQKMALMSDERVCSLLCHDDRFDEDEFIASATKALRGEVFGLQKYFPWGVTTFSMVARNHAQKSRAIEIIMQYAQGAGVRGPVRERIQLAADELMINALYHAPVDERGNELYANVDRKTLAARDQLRPIEIQYGCSGRYFGISVRDGSGSLSRQKALDYLLRVQKGAAADIENKATGAGLGLQSVLRSVSKLVFNLSPGSSTEVIALFDLDLFAQGKVGARSLHMFTASPDEPEPDKGEEEEAQPSHAAVTPQQSSGAFKWFFVAALMLIIGVMGTAVLMQSSLAKQVGAPPSRPHLLLDDAKTVIKLQNTRDPKDSRTLTPKKKFSLDELKDPKGTYKIIVDPPR